MKKLIVKIIGIALTVFPIVLTAQNSSIEKLFDKYTGKDGFTSINISKEMFMLFAQFGEGVENEEVAELNEAISGLNGLKIIICESIVMEETKQTFKKEVNEILEKGTFKELMTVIEPHATFRFMLRKKNEDIIEMILIADEGEKTSAISFFGEIDLEAISKLSQSAKIKGLENMRKLEKKLNEEHDK